MGVLESLADGHHRLHSGRAGPFQHVVAVIVEHGVAEVGVGVQEDGVGVQEDGVGV